MPSNVAKDLKAFWRRLHGEAAPAHEDIRVSIDQRPLGQHLRIALYAVAVGVIAGVAEVAFRYVIRGTTFVFFGFEDGDILDLVADLPWWHVLFAPAIGGLLIGFFIQKFMVGQRPHGVPDVILASYHGHGRLPPKALLGAALISATSAGVGASVGREGPMVHLGASLGSWVGQTLKISEYDTKTLLACGVAAGVAASFNVPLAGTIFAFEVLLMRYSIQRLAPVAIAAVIATAISRVVFGDFPAFRVPEQVLVSFWEFPAFALLGVCCAIAGYALIASVRGVGAFMNKSPVPKILRPALGGLIVGAIALELPQVLSVGYGATTEALAGSYGLTLLLALLVGKIVATSVCLGCGFGGGIFSPSLLVGAALGGAFGMIATMLAPEYSSGHVAYTIVGMGAVAGAVMGAPLQAILILFEMTSSYALALGVMLAVVIASLVLNDGLRIDFFRWQISLRGIRLGEPRPQVTLADMVLGPLTREAATVAADADAATLAAALEAAGAGGVFVVDADGRLVGRLGAPQLLPHLAADAAAVSAENLALPVEPLLRDTHDAADAWRLLEDSGLDRLPVVDGAETRRVVGQLDRAAVLKSYEGALKDSG